MVELTTVGSSSTEYIIAVLIALYFIYTCQSDEIYMYTSKDNCKKIEENIIDFLSECILAIIRLSLTGTKKTFLIIEYS